MRGDRCLTEFIVMTISQYIQTRSLVRISENSGMDPGLHPCQCQSN